MKKIITVLALMFCLLSIPALAQYDQRQGGAATWGQIVGTLADQTDLYLALAAKPAKGILTTGKYCTATSSTTLACTSDAPIPAVGSPTAGDYACLDVSGNVTDCHTHPATKPTNGNMGCFDASGNVIDCNHKPGDYVPLVSTPTNGHTACVDASGNVTDCGHALSEYSLTGHNHTGVYEPIPAGSVPTGDYACFDASKNLIDCGTKPATKPTNGNFGCFDASGNVVDCSAKPADYAAANHNHTGVYIPEVSNPTVDDVATLDASGNIKDGAHKLSEYALSGHNHAGTYQPAGAYVASGSSSPFAITGALTGKLYVVAATQDASGNCTIGVDCDTTSTTVMYGGILEVNPTDASGNNIVTLPAKVQGMYLCVKVVTTATNVVKIAPVGSDFFDLDGTALAAAHKIQSSGSKGDIICFYGSPTANRWEVLWYGKNPWITEPA